MHRYFFFLGRKSELGFAELSSVISRDFNHTTSLSRFSPGIAILETEPQVEVSRLITILGGTVKISLWEKDIGPELAAGEISSLLIRSADREKKINFGISQVGSTDPAFVADLPMQVKDLLNAEGFKTRFLLPKNSNEMTSAQVKLANLLEIVLVWQAGRIRLLRTVAVQDFSGFSERDYRRPFIDPKSGMLPPKVARMMLNLALPAKDPDNVWVLDPFCGTGTVGMEALTLGVKSFNSDLDPEKVSGTVANLTWLQSRLGSQTPWKAVTADVNRLPSLIDVPVDCVVTEPYLGPAEFGSKQLKNIVKGLDKLYLGALKKIHSILPVGGKVAFVFPNITHQSRILSATLAIDRREELGYTLDAGPFTYDRDDAKISRLIYILKKNKER